ncbi:SDR family oxidoreductase [Galbitalea sp. SE-J8]|uniref:SDR family oxidoreductase n=1 Tax=Galbitalea sp. SE-J8 TaxID=3054952 RepID=UPI00259C8CD7|nr:SDR family oxidoreductase [Galbitalea sp. SE-J8]MDM4763843.1 SDR family oxidoreductase [Galbitalea sp. SE-J8]
MRVFVTGASGWIGSAVTDELLAAGHEVVGLARSDAAAASVAAKGAAVQRGDLDDLDSLRAGAEGADAIVHLAFKHDFSNFAESGRAERAAVELFGELLDGTGRALLLASVVAGLTSGRAATEDDANPSAGPDAPRGGAENLALGFAERGVRAVALRFSATVHGRGDHGFIAELSRVARDRGVAAYVGEGTNRWAAVHRLDAARLVRLALESAPAGAIVHAVAEEGVATRDIATELGAALGLPTASVDPEDAAEHFGWIARFFALDLRASSALTRARFGWEPTGPSLADDIRAGYYTR